MKIQGSSKLDSVCCLQGPSGEQGLAVLKHSSHGFKAVLPFVMDPSHPVDVITVPSWLSHSLRNIANDFTWQKIDPTSLPIASRVQVQAAKSPFLSSYSLEDPLVTFLGDEHCHWYSELQRLHVWTVIKAFLIKDDSSEVEIDMDSMFKIDSSTKISFSEIDTERKTTDPFLMDIFNDLIPPLEAQINVLLGVPRCLDPLIGEKFGHHYLDPLSFAHVPEELERTNELNVKCEGPVSVLFSADYLIQDETLKRFKEFLKNQVDKKFIIVFSGVDQQHPFIKMLVQEFAEDTIVKLVAPLNISHYERFIDANPIFNCLSPQLLAGLTLDDLIFRLFSENDADQSSLKQRLQSLHEQTWKTFGGKVLDPTDYDWSRIIGYDDTISYLRDLVYLPHLKRTEYQRMGLTAPKGILVYGPPGNGKTLITTTLAADAICTVIMVESVHLFSKYFGETEERLRQLFLQARSRQPCLLIFDDLESIGIKRGGPSDQDDTTGIANRVLLTLLNELDGVDPLTGVTIIGCCHDPSQLDDALLRPGRMDHHLYVGNPTDSSILLQHFISLFGTADENLVNNLLDHYPVLKSSEKSVADLKSLVQNAWLNCQLRRRRQGDDKLVMEDFEII